LHYSSDTMFNMNRLKPRYVLISGIAVAIAVTALAETHKTSSSELRQVLEQQADEVAYNKGHVTASGTGMFTAKKDRYSSLSSAIGETLFAADASVISENPHASAAAACMEWTANKTADGKSWRDWPSDAVHAYQLALAIGNDNNPDAQADYTAAYQACTNNELFDPANSDHNHPLFFKQSEEITVITGVGDQS